MATRILKSPRDGTKNAMIATTLLVLAKKAYTAAIIFEAKGNLFRLAERPLMCDMTLLIKLHVVDA